MTTDAEVFACWRRIEAWLAANVPPLARALRPPAADEEVARAEGVLGVRFPAEFRASLAVHDGQDDGAFEVFGTWGLLDLRSCVDTWRMMSSLVDTGVLLLHDEGRAVSGPGAVRQGAVRPGAWDRARIPFASKGTGDYLVLDGRPGPGGHEGQLVTFGRDGGDARLVAPGFGAWLGQVAAGFEGGTYGVAAGGSRLTRRRR